MWRSGRIGSAAGSKTFGYGKCLEGWRPEFVGGGKSRPFGDEESVGRDAERRVVVEPAPSAAFIVAEPEFLLEILIIALDAPAQLCLID